MASIQDFSLHATSWWYKTQMSYKSFYCNRLRNLHHNRFKHVEQVRPRGWHLFEKHLLVDGCPVPAGIFDFGLFFFHNAAVLRDKGSGPYFYLPKMESHLEARLWNSVFVEAQVTFDHSSQSKGIGTATLYEELLGGMPLKHIANFFSSKRYRSLQEQCRSVASEC